MAKGVFTIIGNMIEGNGADSSQIGGVLIDASANASSLVEFNTFSGNLAQSGVAHHLQCDILGFTAKNNIFNSGILASSSLIGGSCGHDYSIVSAGTVPPGIGNLHIDPMFVDTATGDLHIRPGSPAHRAADPASDLSGFAGRDIDGDMRIAPADIGADQLPR